jgi:multiple sugar transport system permease protein
VRNKRGSQLGSASLFLAPNFIGFLVFLAVPLVVSLGMAFTNWDLSMGNKMVDPAIRPMPNELEFVGLQNFSDLFTSNTFWLYFANTLYLMLGIPFGIAGSLILALLLNKPLQENTFLGRCIHAAAAGVAFLVIGSAIWFAGRESLAITVLGQSVMLLGCFYALAVFAGIVVYRTMYYLPSFVAGVAVFILWKNLYHGDFGPIALAAQGVWSGCIDLYNTVGGWLGLSAVAQPGPGEQFRPLASTNNLLGLSSETVAFSTGFFGLGAREALIFMGLVTGIGGSNMLLYLAGLSNIPQELYEAADIDGANKWQRFWAVTWPQLAPTTFFIVVMSCIGGLQGGFDVAKVMTNGGPAGTTTTLNYFIYTRAFEQGRLGYASAAAWMLFVMVFVVTLINFRFGSRKTNE